MEDNKDLVSVIVPVYKVEKYLDRCIKSIREQTYTELEIILVDDGSPDSCGRMCDEYAASDDRIKVIHKQNGGLSDARNAGIEAATGQWIVFVDSDDYISTEMISYLKSVADENSADIAWCRYKETAADEEDAAFDSKGSVEEICSGRDAEYLFYRMGMMSECMVAWNKLYSKSLFGQVHIIVFTYKRAIQPILIYGFGSSV
jgi:glycosyltransferase involved in cell wall biosynthesis